MDYKQILGVKIDLVNKVEALKKVSDFLNSNKQFKIFTPNPEMIVDANKDRYFKNVLNSGNLNICDGFGLSFFSRTQRIAGTDFMIEICKLASKNGNKIFLLGSGNEDVIKKTVEKLQKTIQNLNIVGFYHGDNVTIEQYENNVTNLKYSKEKNDQLIQKINKTNAQILFVAFGHNKQEKWIYENLSKIPSIKIAMGVGGAFDYISCFKKRAPKLIRQIGLEWLFRLFLEPKRIKRIFKAVIIFPYLILKNKIFFHSN